MRKIINFSKVFLPAAVCSIILVSAGIVSFFVMGGFNLGVDFQAGLIQEVQFAPTAFSLTWSGRGNATIEFDRTGLHIVNSGVGVDSRTVSFPFSQYQTLGELTQDLSAKMEGLSARLNVPESLDPQWLVRTAQGNPQLGAEPYPVHYLDPQSEPISIASVREAMTSLGQTIAVQSLGQPGDRHFMIRMDDRQDEGEEGVPAEKITAILEDTFGEGEVVVLRSDYVGSRFSKNLTDQAGILLGFTLLLILGYASIRFKPQYAFGAVIGILHDALIIVSFVVWTRMEFNTTTIAALLTVLGYSINNTIVIFDRIRENRRIYPEEVFVQVLNRSLSETLGRSIITTLTTMLAVISLFIFTTGSMKDFALALLVGMTSGVYTSMFIACGFVNFWENTKTKRKKRIVSAGQPVKGAAKA